MKNDSFEKTLKALTKELNLASRTYNKKYRSSFTDDDSNSYFDAIRMGGIKDGLSMAISIIKKSIKKK